MGGGEYDSERVAKYGSWIEMLQQGQNPFDSDTLGKLQNENR